MNAQSRGGCLGRWEPAFTTSTLAQAGHGSPWLPMAPRPGCLAGWLLAGWILGWVTAGWLNAFLSGCWLAECFARWLLAG
eukprot:356842-Chlamydomonas_euryale.AAC.1